MFNSILAKAAITLASLALAGAAPAITLVTTDRGAFDAAISGLATQTLDFDSPATPALTVIADGDRFGNVGLAFDRGPFSGGFDMLVSDFVDPGGNRYLGVNDINDLFLDEDGVIFDFDQPVVAIGLNVITPVNSTLDGSGNAQPFYRLSAGGQTIVNGAPLAPSAAPNPFDDFFFLGIIDTDAPFLSASLASVDSLAVDALGNPLFDGGFVSFHVDDIVIAAAEPGRLPTPASAPLLLLGFAGTLLLCWRKRDPRGL